MELIKRVLWIAIKERNIELAKAIIRHCEDEYISEKNELNVQNIKKMGS